MQKKSKLLTFVLCIFFGLALFLIILYPQKSLQGAKNGINISINTLLPTLFPFMLISIFLLTSGLAEKIFYYPSRILSKIIKKDAEYFTIFFISIMGGYVTAAKSISQYYKKGIITKKSAETLVCTFSNAGPAFLISAIGVGMFFSISLGIVLYLSSVLTSITMFFIYYNNIENTIKKLKSVTISYPEAFVYSVNNTCSIMAIICSCVILFSVLLAFYPKELGGTIIGMLEVTSGVIFVSSNLNFKNIVITAFITGFSGICIIMQISSVLAQSGLSAKKFLISRFIYAPIMTIYTVILINIVPITSSQTFTNNTTEVFCQKSISTVSSILLLVCCVLFPIYISSAKNNKI